MDERAGREDRPRTAPRWSAADAAETPPAAERRPEFTPAERRRLVFLRWLYRRERLTEFPERLPV
jgi:hypothetical protein